MVLLAFPVAFTMMSLGYEQSTPDYYALEWPVKAASGFHTL